jgi:hypothetical protein
VCEEKRVLCPIKNNMDDLALIGILAEHAVFGIAAAAAAGLGGGGDPLAFLNNDDAIDGIATDQFQPRVQIEREHQPIMVSLEEDEEMENAANGGGVRGLEFLTETERALRSKDPEPEAIIVKRRTLENELDVLMMVPDSSKGGGIDEMECPICVSETPQKDMIQCPECDYNSCRECVYTFYEKGDDSETKLFPTCGNCKTQWSIHFFMRYLLPPGGTNLAKNVIRIMSDRHMKQLLNREVPLLSASAHQARAYKTRMLFIEALIQYRSECLIAASNVNVERLTGKDSFNIPAIQISEVSLPKVSDSILEFEPFDDVIFSLIKPLIHTASLEVHPASRCKRSDIARLVAYTAVATATVYRYTQPIASFSSFSGVKAAFARRVYFIRASDANALYRFFIHLPREWWSRATDGSLVAVAIESAIINRFMRGDRNVKEKIQTVLSTNAARLAVAGRGGISNAAREDDIGIAAVRMVCINAAQGCRGFMHLVSIGTLASTRGTESERPVSSLVCQICEAVACRDCRENVSRASLLRGEHSCDEGILANIREIDRSARPCPRCTTPIVRIEGCPDMFCPKCKLPYSWDTMQARFSNTNPAFAEWVSHVRARGGMGSDNNTAQHDNVVQTIREAFAPTVRGEDGLTFDERIQGVGEILLANRLNVSAYLATVVVSKIETLFISSLVSNLPTQTEFENLRIIYLIGDITEAEWKERCMRMEIRSITAQRVIRILEMFCNTTFDATKKAHVALENRLKQLREENSGGVVSRMEQDIARAEIEANVLRIAATAASIASNEFQSTIACAHAILNPDDNYDAYRVIESRHCPRLFAHAGRFVKCLDRKDNGIDAQAPPPTNVNPAIQQERQLRASLRDGGYRFWSERAPESRRMAQIFHVPAPIHIVKSIFSHTIGCPSDRI